MAETLVVVSKVKKMVKELGFRTSGDAIEKLSQMVDAKVKAAVEKVKTSGRKTISAEDIE